MVFKDILADTPDVHKLEEFMDDNPFIWSYARQLYLNVFLLANLAQFIL